MERGTGSMEQKAGQHVTSSEHRAQGMGRVQGAGSKYKLRAQGTEHRAKSRGLGAWGREQGHKRLDLTQMLTIKSALHKLVNPEKIILPLLHDHKG